ncbi:MAG: hypothetical protein AAFZ52_06445, partial [Bacteroidota bacterium]
MQRFLFSFSLALLWSSGLVAQPGVPPTSLYQDAGRVAELLEEVVIPPVKVLFDLRFPTRAQSRVLDIERVNDRFARPLWRERIYGIYPEFQLQEGDELAIFLDYASQGDSIAFLRQGDTIRYRAPLYVYYDGGELIVSKLEVTDVPTEPAWRVPQEVSNEAPILLTILSKTGEEVNREYEIKEANVASGQYAVRIPSVEYQFNEYYDEVIYRRTVVDEEPRQDSLLVSWGDNKRAFALQHAPATEESRGKSHEYVLQIVLGESGLLVRPLDRQLQIGAFLLYEIYRDYSRIDELTKRLAFHTEMTEAGSKGYTYSFPRVRQKLLDNPFLRGKIAQSSLLKQEEEDYYYYDFTKQLRQAYPWHRILYGDSLLQLEKQLSFEDLATSYREPITSRKELALASTAIDANRNKGSLLDARTVAVGLSDFIAERAQEELNLTFFERFKANLQGPSELTILFPSTRDLLYQFQISNYKTLLSFAKTAFQTDLDNLGLNFPRVLDLDKYTELKNDPNVFNLSLIYSIADLAYKEYPIETIMLATNQKLRKRKQDLGAAINLRISEGALASFPQEEIYQLDKISPAFRKWRAFKDTLGAYLYQLNRQSEAIADLHRYGSEFAGVVQHADSLGNVALKNRMDTIRNDWSQENATFELLTSERILYQGREIFESRLRFAENVINDNLNGWPYYGYIIDQPRLEDYDQYFGEQAQDARINIAAGLQQVRELLDEEAEAKLSTRTNRLLVGVQTARDVEAHLQLQRAQNRFARAMVDSLSNCANLLGNAIEAETVLWQRLTGRALGENNVAGLRYLRSVLNREYAERGGNDLEFNLDQILSQVTATFGLQEQAAGSSPSLLPRRIEQLYAFLDTIQGRLLDQRSRLRQGLGARKVSSAKYQHLQTLDQLAFTLGQTDAKYERAWEQREAVFRRVTNQERTFDFTTIPAYRTADSLLRAKEVSLDSARRQANEEVIYYASLEYDAAEYELYEARRDALFTLSPELVAADSVFRKTMRELDKIYDSRGVRYDSISFLADQEQIADVTVAALMDATPFRNQYLERYQTSRRLEITVDSTSLLPFYRAERDIIAFNHELDRLTRLRLAVQRQLQELEVDYSADLVRARRNAANLGRAVELATHLLFAFRDYSRSDEAITVRDTLLMEMQEMVPDTNTGGTNVRSFQQIQVNKTKIKPSRKQRATARWLHSEDFDRLRNDENRWNIFLGLLYERLQSVEDAPDFSPQGVALLATKFFNIANNVDQTLITLRRKRKLAAAEVGFRDYYPFIRSSVDLFNTMITTPLTGESSIADRDSTMAVIPKISNEALSLYENIFVKNYSEAVLNSMELLKIIAENGFKGKKDRRKALSKVNGILRYGTFMAKMIDAESANQVRDILRSQALPPGSSREKRE